MSQFNDLDLPIDSECCRYLCAELNRAQYRENAKCSVDLLSGGFKFSDEVPEHLKEPVGRDRTSRIRVLALQR
jgi:hypothetical protein